MKQSKKGFTLAETMVTLALVGVVAGITMPILMNARVEKDTQVYRKALYTLQRATYNFINGTGYIELQKSILDNPDKTYSENNYLSNFTNKEVCEKIADEINTRGEINCEKTGTDTPNFVTTDGIGFYDLGGDGKFTHKVILVKRIGETKQETENRKKKEGAHDKGFLRIHLNYRGKISTPANGQTIYYPGQASGNAESYDWKYEQTLIKDYSKLNK